MKVKAIPNNFFNKLDLSSPKLLKGIKFAQKNVNQLEYIKSLFIDDIQAIFSKSYSDAEQLAEELLGLKTLTNVMVQNTIMHSYIDTENGYSLMQKISNHEKQVEQLSLNL